MCNEKGVTHTVKTNPWKTLQFLSEGRKNFKIFSFNVLFFTARNFTVLVQSHCAASVIRKTKLVTCW